MCSRYSWYSPVMLKKLSSSTSLTLKTKITALVLLLFLCSIWVLTFIISKRLEQKMTAQLEEQQFSIASYIANSIEGQVRLRINSLRTIADRITPELMANPGKLREFLSDQPLLANLFQTGCVVISREGIEIADYPKLQGREGSLLLEMEYFNEVVATGKPAVGKPRIGRFSKKPVIGFAVPVTSHSGKLIAVLAGYTLLADPALLGSIENSEYKDFPDRLLLVSPKYRIYITGSDPTRTMTPTPKNGVNPLFDRFMSGFEGSGITVNSRHIRMLMSAKYIPTPDWFIRVGLPTEIVFSPIRSMRNWAYSIALGLSLLSSLLVWLVIRQALRPLSNASKLIRDITEERLPLQDIPVAHYDEVGQLLSSFNMLLNFHKLAEDALYKTAIEIEDLYNNAPCGYHSLDKDGVFQQINNTELAWLGYSREDVLRRMKWSDVITAASLRTYREKFLEFKERGYVRDLEYEMVRKDGTVFVGLVNAAALYDSDGNYVASRGTLVDITERKTVEEALRKSEAKFKAMVDTLPLAIYLNVGIEQVGEYLNPTFIKLFGYTMEDVPSISEWLPLAYPDETYRRQLSEEWTIRVKRAMETQSHIEPMESVVTCKDGSKKNILWGYIPMGDKNYAYGLDLTENKKAEKLTAHLAAIVQSADDAIISEDLSGIIETWNAGAEKIFGYTAQEIIGKHISVLLPPGHTDEVPDISGRISMGENMEHFETVRMRKDGTLIQVLLTFSAIKDENYRTVGVSEIAHDISVRKRIETERDKLIIELKEALAKVKKLSGLLPICASCKKIRNDQGFWEQVETYITEHSEALFSHAICPECGKKLYPQYYDNVWGKEDK